MNPEMNGHRPPYQVDTHDPAVVARLIVLGHLHNDQASIDLLARRRPELDIDLLRLVAEIVVSVNLDMAEPANANRILYVRTPRSI